MTPQTVRALLAYGITLGFFACLCVLIFYPMSATVTTMVGTMTGALMANWKMPLAYFYDGLPKESTTPPPAAPPAETQP